MKLYFPESFNQINYVGYNHAVLLFNKCFKDKITNNIKEADFRIYCNLPWHHKPKQLKGKIPLIVFTMYESNRIPNGWRKFLNNYADIILVPSKWCKDNFIKNGITKPIFILSLCYDPDEFQKVPKTLNKDQYVYLWQGVTFDRGGRKGFDIAIDAFKELKKEKRIGEDTRLIVKTRPHKERNVEINNVETSNGIIYLQRKLNKQEIFELYSTVDCCINPTHGEGFGLVPLEQMAMGKPVLVTDYSMDYVNKECCFPLKYKLKKSPIYWNHKFLQLSVNGIVFNVGGLTTEIHFLPKFVRKIPDGNNVMFIDKDRIIKNDKLPILKRIKAFVINNFSDFQNKFKLFPNKNRKSLFIPFENPGEDAFVDKEDLKNKMIYCYENKSIAEDMGFVAHEYVSRSWTLERMKEDWECIEDYLSKTYNIKKES